MHALPKAIAAKIWLLASLIAVQSLLAQQGYKLGDLKTVDGHEYHGVTVTEKSCDGIAIRHKSGVVRLLWSEVPVETQRLLGYDAAAEAAAQQKAAAAKQREAARPFIGMTEAEARVRYGEPVKQGTEAPADKVLTFEKDGIYLITFFLHGRVGNVTYTRKDKRPFLPEEAEVLLQNNSQGGRWAYRSDVPENQNWEAADGSMLAINHSDYSGLVIATREYLNAMKRVSADSLKGL